MKRRNFLIGFFCSFFCFILAFAPLGYAITIIDNFGGDELDYSVWYQYYANDNNAVVGNGCLNLTTTEDINGDNLSICQVYTIRWWKDASFEVKFKLVNYSWSGVETNYWAFWFYRDSTQEFDVEFGFYEDIRQIKVTTFSDGYYVPTWITAPRFFNDSDWHTVRVDWKFTANVTVDGVRLLTNWIMPYKPMGFNIGVFSKVNHTFTLLVDYVILEDATVETHLDSPVQTLTDPVYWVPVVMVFVLIGMVKWWWQ